jgi:hypothetical protein
MRLCAAEQVLRGAFTPLERICTRFEQSVQKILTVLKQLTIQPNFRKINKIQYYNSVYSAFYVKIQVLQLREKVFDNRVIAEQHFRGGSGHGEKIILLRFIGKQFVE